MPPLARYRILSGTSGGNTRSNDMQITLSKNKRKALRRLTQKKFRESEELFFVEGIRLVSEAVDSDFEITEVYYTSDVVSHPQGRMLIEKLQPKVRPEQLSSRAMSAISETVTDQGIVAFLRRRHQTAEAILSVNDAQSLIIAFDGIADPGNVGSMVRTCDWFGVDGILFGRNSVELYNPKVLRATMGGVFHLPIAENVDLLSTISKAKEMGYRIYVTDLHGETHCDKAVYESKSLIVFGNEAWGVSDQVKALADIKLLIRKYGAGESLNVGVACGVILSHVHRLYD